MADSSVPLKRTPLHSVHKQLGARMVPFGGWDMPVDYGSQLDEHQTVRKHVGIFDVSHMGQVRLKGIRALAFLAHLVPGNTGKLNDGGSLYTTLCNENGGTIDDLIVTRIGEQEAFVVVNAGTREKDVAWIIEQRGKLGFDDVEIIDESDQWAMIALQGPEALAIADRLFAPNRWSETKSMTMHSHMHNGTQCLISRTGYTGEPGIEIMCPAAIAETVWKSLQDAGARPIGLGARDSLRLEMGFPLYGQDLSETISPLEAGIGWTVSYEKPEAYIGREALERQKSKGSFRVRVGLQLDSRRPMRRGDIISDGFNHVGEVTSGGFSPTLGAGIALGLIDREIAKGKKEFYILSRGTELKAHVVKPPFVKK